MTRTKSVSREERTVSHWILHGAILVNERKTPDYKGHLLNYRRSFNDDHKEASVGPGLSRGKLTRKRMLEGRQSSFPQSNQTGKLSRKEWGEKARLNQMIKMGYKWSKLRYDHLTPVNQLFLLPLCPFLSPSLLPSLSTSCPLPFLLPLFFFLFSSSFCLTYHCILLGFLIIGK